MIGIFLKSTGYIQKDRAFLIIITENENVLLYARYTSGFMPAGRRNIIRNIVAIEYLVSY